MLIDIIKQFNWVDIIIVSLFIRLVYIAAEKGLVTELFKLLGTLLALFLAMHYYTGISDFARGRANLKFLPLEFLDFLFYAVLVAVGYLFFLVAREAVVKMAKTEVIAPINKWGGLILGLARAVFTCAIVAYMLVICSISYMKISVKSSYLGKRMFGVAVETYDSMWNGLISKFAGQEKYNKAVAEIREGFNK